MTHESLTCSREDRVAAITLDRPERLNALTRLMPEEMRAAAELDAAVRGLIDRVKGVPDNQLWRQKTAINSAFENMGMRTIQTLATLFDGMTRHSPEGA